MELQRSATGILRHLEPGIGANRSKRKQRKRKGQILFSSLQRTLPAPRVQRRGRLYPRFDGDGQIMKMDHGTYYCDFSQWDTYRAVHPLFSILTPSRNGDMAHSLVLKDSRAAGCPSSRPGTATRLP